MSVKVPGRLKNTTRTFEPFDRGKALAQDRRDLIRRSAMGSRDRGQRFEDNSYER